MRTRTSVWTVPDVQRLGPAVVIQGDALTLLTHLAVAGASEISRRNGFISPSTRALLDHMARAEREARATSVAAGHADVRTELDPTESESLGSAEVAGEVGCTERHVRRLAAAGELAGYRSSKGWRFRRSEVKAYQAQLERRTSA